MTLSKKELLEKVNRYTWCHNIDLGNGIITPGRGWNFIWKPSTKFLERAGIGANGYMHRHIDHSKGEFFDTKGNHINGLEGFWRYLKRNLAFKDGIRQEKLPLYLAEYVWRFNHRQCSIDEQNTTLLKMLYNYKQIHNN